MLGARKLMMFATSGAVAISNQDIHDTTIGPTAEAQYTLALSGAASSVTSGGGSVPISGEWLTSGSSSDFEVRATIVSGSVTSGTIGSWENLGTTRTWTRDRGAIGISTVVLTIEIRNATSMVVLDTAEITLTAEIS